MRKFRTFSGIAYRDVYRGNNQPINVTTNQYDREAFYRDDAVRLSTKDVGNFINKPIFIEHDGLKEPAGKIVHSFLDSDGYMRIVAHIYTDSPHGEQIWANIQAGHLKGLSVGYDLTKDNLYKKCREVSLCKEPFFEGAEVRVTASANNLSSTREKTIYYRIEMSNIQQQQPPQVEPVQPNKDASELMLEMTNLRKRVAEFDGMDVQKLRKLQEMGGLDNAIGAVEENIKRKKVIMDKRAKEGLEYAKSTADIYEQHNPEAKIERDEYNKVVASAWVATDPNVVMLCRILASNQQVAEENAKELERLRSNEKQQNAQLKQIMASGTPVRENTAILRPTANTGIDRIFTPVNASVPTSSFLDMLRNPDLQSVDTSGFEMRST